MRSPSLPPLLRADRADGFASASDALRAKIRACAARAFAAQQTAGAGAPEQEREQDRMIETLSGKAAQGSRGRRRIRQDGARQAG